MEEIKKEEIQKEGLKILSSILIVNYELIFYIKLFESIFIIINQSIKNHILKNHFTIWLRIINNLVLIKFNQNKKEGKSLSLFFILLI